MTDVNLFHRASLVRNRMRAQRLSPVGSFLFEEVGNRLADRLLDVQRPFPVTLDLSGQPGFSTLLAKSGAIKARKMDMIVATADAPEMAHDGLLVASNQELLPFADACADLAVSVMALHWVNDLPGVLAQIRRTLRPDGLFLAAFLGGDTLVELRECLAAAEIEVSGGISPRVIPLVDIRDAGGLLQRAGFSLPVADRDRIDTTYTSVIALMRDLRAMGETNALVQRRRHFSSRTLFVRAGELYAERYGRDDRIPATFDVTYLAGWAPHASQQKPLRPGSAKTRLATALDADEQSAGEKTAPMGSKKIP
ncbi:MAG: methyltransferase domain-containing protein [Alphaproteobacteria bacterium]|nr:methyltransferase domain-containing protein [Alphaproteobacteria bacterium]